MERGAFGFSNDKSLMYWPRTPIAGAVFCSGPPFAFAMIVSKNPSEIAVKRGPARYHASSGGTRMAPLQALPDVCRSLLARAGGSFNVGSKARCALGQRSPSDHILRYGEPSFAADVRFCSARRTKRKSARFLHHHLFGSRGVHFCAASKR